uniref:Tubulin epsilon and delta complex 1 n=1 Tax=Crocodylus porosus TaxID=8502 RepID=A0A7M4DYA9_CROPO
MKCTCRAGFIRKIHKAVLCKLLYLNEIRFVKSVLRYHGYGRPEFYRLPSDGSVGSRELLLAFSWLLHRINLLEQLLHVNRVRIGDETSLCTCGDNLLKSWKGMTELAPEPGLKNEVDIRYLQWLNGRLRFQWRSLHVDYQEQCKLLYKIHFYTNGSHMDQTIGHFSVTETDLIRQPDNYKQLMQLLESETSRLEAFLEWKQLEPVYWQWMITDFYLISSKTSFSFDILHCVVVGGILHTSLTMIFSQQIKARERELLDEKEFSEAIRKIHEAVELKLSEFKYQCAHKKNKMHGPCRLVFKDKHPALMNVSASELVNELRMREGRLEKELKQLQEECRHKLTEIVDGLDGVICIPPMKR